jgi:four helix bundle protein
MSESTTASSTTSRFPHQRLVAYRVALELFVEVERLAGKLPHGYADLKDQVRRAAGSAVRNIAEGANRVQPRDKAARFVIALGEIGECEAALEMIQLLDLAAWSVVDELRRTAGRVAALVTGLVHRQRVRPSAAPGRRPLSGASAHAARRVPRRAGRLALPLWAMSDHVREERSESHVLNGGQPEVVPDLADIRE